jgi:hypothetical protein
MATASAAGAAAASAAGAAAAAGVPTPASTTSSTSDVDEAKQEVACILAIDAYDNPCYVQLHKTLYIPHDSKWPLLAEVETWIFEETMPLRPRTPQLSTQHAPSQPKQYRWTVNRVLYTERWTQMFLHNNPKTFAITNGGVVVEPTLFVLHAPSEELDIKIQWPRDTPAQLRVTSDVTIPVAVSKLSPSQNFLNEVQSVLLLTYERQFMVQFTVRVVPGPMHKLRRMHFMKLD